MIPINGLTGCFLCVCSLLHIANGFHIAINHKEYTTIGEQKVYATDLQNHLEEHEKALLFGNITARPHVKIVHVTRKSQPQRKRTKRSSEGLLSVKLEDSDQSNMELRQSPKLIDDAFILIRRYENTSQFIENSHNLAAEYEKCFYRNENSALDLCEKDRIRGLFYYNSTSFIIHPLPERFGKNSHIIFRPKNHTIVDQHYGQQQKTRNQQNRQQQENGNLNQSQNENNYGKRVNDILFEPDADGFTDMAIVKELNEHKRNENSTDYHRGAQEEEMAVGKQHKFHSQTSERVEITLKKDIISKNNNNSVNSSNDNINNNLLTMSTLLRRHGHDDLRVKRHISTQWKIPQVLHIETAVFVDKDLFKHMARNYPKATESHLIRFVLAMINGVQLLYHHPSLGHQINFVLKRLEILHSDPKELRRSSDIDIFLNNFCMWQRKLNPASDADVLHYDHAVILTGLDLYVVGKNGKVSSQVVGLAPVAGMCTSTSSCTINEGKHFESVFVVAHEIGHNLGMRHDTSENNCDPSLYIMSPTLGSGKITWSKCSRSYLNTFLETTQSHCMFDRGKFGNSLDHSAEGILPGERFDADQQCMLKYGKDSIRSRSQPLADICRDLHCQRDRYTWTSHPALEGTDCGEMMWCRSGICVMKAALMESYSVPKQVQTVTKHLDKVNFVEDKKLSNLRHEYNFNKAPAWSQWGEPSDCDSGCLYGSSGRLREGSTGLKTILRSCLDYRKRCTGRDRKYESCTPKQCYSIAITTIDDFATQICERAKKFDNELTGEGLQNVALSVEDSCKVFCQTKNNGTKSRSWTFPDGTTCRTQNYEFDDASYCVNGRCEKFSCTNSSTNYYKMDTAFCPQSLVQVQEESKQTNQVYQENGRDFKSARLRTYLKNDNDYPGSGMHGPNPNQNPTNIMRKSDTYNNHHSNHVPSDHNANFESLWTVKSGCHFSCMQRAKGIQVIKSKMDNTNNVQLCAPKIIPCDRLQTTSEFAENLCSRYKLKVRGLSGYGMQISPSVKDPDRSCRVACQDEYLHHRFYLVNSDHGLFPFGTKCSPDDERYCINGKCLEFGSDNIPLTQSYISLALFRSKRDLTQSIDRLKRSYLYYKPVNITERLTQQFLDKVARNIDFSRTILDEPISNEHIEFTNPIHIPFEELINV